MNEGEFGTKQCVVCHSEFVVYLRDFLASKSGTHVAAQFCLECQSLSTDRTGFGEDSEYKKGEASWHLSVQERNSVWSRRLLDHVSSHYPKVRSIVEIGCGTGTLLGIAARDYGMRVRGYDTNTYAIELGRELYPDLDLRNELFTPKSVVDDFDLVVCISTLEHLVEPRHLAGEIADYCKRMDSVAFCSVPYFERKDWPYLLEENGAIDMGSPFHLVDFHVTHFTKVGMERMVASLGASSAKFAAAGWHGHFLEFGHGESVASASDSGNADVSVSDAARRLRRQVKELESRNEQLKTQLANIHRSRWIRLGQRLGLSKIARARS